MSQVMYNFASIFSPLMTEANRGTTKTDTWKCIDTLAKLKMEIKELLKLAMDNRQKLFKRYFIKNEYRKFSK